MYATAVGANVVDVDGNRYVDLAAGFGAGLLGHAHPAVRRALALQAERLLATRSATCTLPTRRSRFRNDWPPSTPSRAPR